MNTVPISDTPDGMPGAIAYDATTETLHVGGGQIRPVSQDVWGYETSGMKIVKKWFDYRRRDPRGLRSSPLDDINPEYWSAAFTRELLELLRVLTRCVELELHQGEILDRIRQGPLINVADLEQAKVLPPSPASRKPMAPELGTKLF